MLKLPKQTYTAEFKDQAVQRLRDGQSIGAMARELGMSAQTLCNWAKAARGGKLVGAGGKTVTPEQMELDSFLDQPALLVIVDKAPRLFRHCLPIFV